jgi:hypothetical protein
MSNRALIVHGLNRPAFKKEVTMGVVPLAFLHDGTTKIIGIEQTTENPYNPTDTNNQQQIKVTTGNHLQSNATIQNGRKDTLLDVTTAINKNDFISPASRFLQKYSYTGKLFATTVTAIVNSATVSVLTVADATGIVEGMELSVTGRVLSAEDKIYNIINVDGSDITIDGVIDDGDLTGAFDSTIGVHKLKVQADDCDKYLEQSNTLWLPNDFPNEANQCGENGELVTGLAPMALNLDLMAATSQITMRGKSYDRNYVDQPKYTTSPATSDYLEPTTEKEGFSSTEAGVMEWYNGTTWNELDTESLQCNIIMGLNEDSKVFRANKFSRVIIDGVDVSGTYGSTVLEKDDDNNIANSIIDKRDSENNSIVGRVKLINEDGTGFYIEGNVTFMNPTTPTKDLGGFVFSTDFMFTTSDTYQNVEMTVLNNYTEDLTTYL